MAVNGKSLNFQRNGFLQPIVSAGADHAINISIENQGGVFGPPASSDPVLTSDDAGYTYFNTASHVLRFWDGSTWQAVSEASVPTSAWLPLTTVVGGVPDLVWSGTDALIPTYGPL